MPLMSRTARRPVLAGVVLVALTALAGCNGSDDDGGPAASTSTSSSTSTSQPATTTTSDPGLSTTSTSAGPGFDGTTDPTSAPAPPGATDVALLSQVRVAAQSGADRVVFEFVDDQLPGYDVAYIDGPARADGSGDVVDVEGDALLQVRFEPASGVDLRGGTFEQTYTGPPRLAGDTEVVTEVVRTGDFEANLTWVIGVDREVPYRVEVLDDPPRVVIDLST
ncbi:MAG: AMIN-like domain-containing (lipo)protein [Acidimicrobiales bacterium]